MRHKVYGKHLGRDANARTALFRNLVQSLFLEEKIVTSEAKAKAIKGTVDKLINQAKSPSTRRLVNQFVTHKKTQEKLIKELLPRLKNRNSGYTSIIRLGRRMGDNTAMVQVSLILEEGGVKASPKTSSDPRKEVEVKSKKVKSTSKKSKL